jgi:hypothetical protein
MMPGEEGKAAVPPPPPPSVVVTPAPEAVKPVRMPTCTSMLKVSESWPGVEEFQAVVRPLGASGAGAAMLVLPRDGENAILEVFDSVGTPMGKRPFADPRGPITGSPLTSYAVSADGTRVARLSTSLGLSIQVSRWGLNELERSISLEGVVASAELMGFQSLAGGSKTGVLYRGTLTSGGAVLGWADLKGSKLPMPMELEGRLLEVGMCGVGGQQLAVVRRVKGRPCVSVVSMESLAGSGGADRAKQKDFGLELGVAPSGVAVSSDGKVVAAFYKVDGGLVRTYLVGGTGSVKAEQMYTKPVGNYPAMFEGSAIAIAPGGKWMLLYGDAIVEMSSLKVVDRLGVPGVVAQHFLSDDTVELVVEVSGVKRLMRIKLDGEKLGERLAAEAAAGKR